MTMRRQTDFAHLAAVIRLAGPSLRTLELRQIRLVVVNSFEAHVTNLRQLILFNVSASYPLERLLDRCNRTLTDLRLVVASGRPMSHMQLRAIGRCTNLEGFWIRTNIFDHDWTAVWRGIGARLQRLSLGPARFLIMESAAEGLPMQIGRHCTSLRELHLFRFGPELNTAFVRMCGGYGARLEALRLEQCQMTRADLAYLAHMCPTTLVSVYHGLLGFSDEYNVDVVELLGRQLERLYYRAQKPYDESVLHIGRHCSTLRELHLDCAWVLDEHELTTLLAAVAPRLRGLTLGFFAHGLDGMAMRAAIGLLAARCEELQELQIDGGNLEADMLAAVAWRCATSLRRMYVKFGSYSRHVRSREATRLVVTLVRGMYPCVRLEELVVNEMSVQGLANEREVAGACYILRRRECLQRLLVCGTEYLR